MPASRVGGVGRGHAVLPSRCAAGRLPMPGTTVLSGIGTGRHPVGGTASEWASPWGWGRARPARLLFSFRVGACSCAPTMAFCTFSFFLFFWLRRTPWWRLFLLRRRCGAWVLVEDEDGLGGWCVGSHPQPTGFTLLVEVWLARHPRGHPHREKRVRPCLRLDARLCVSRVWRRHVRKTSVFLPPHLGAERAPKTAPFSDTSPPPANSFISRGWREQVRDCCGVHGSTLWSTGCSGPPGAEGHFPRVSGGALASCRRAARVCGRARGARLRGVVRIGGGEATLSLMLYCSRRVAPVMAPKPLCRPAAIG